MSRYRIGIDVGGTFTDLYLVDQATGRTARHKLLSTPGEPHLAPLAGIREILGKVGAAGSDVAFVGPEIRCHDDPHSAPTIAGSMAP